jgi:hypothetical protein
MKKSVSLILTAFLVLLVLTPAFAATEYEVVKEKEQRIEEDKKSKKNKVVKLSREEIEQLAKQYDQDPNTIVSAEKIYFEVSEEEVEDEFSASAGDDYYLKNIEAGETGGNIFHKDKIIGPFHYTATIKDTFSSEVSSEISAEIGWDGTKVASKLGAKWVVSKEFWTQVDTDVPKGKTYTFYAAPLYNYYTFEIWEDDLWYDDYIGSYYFKQPMGVIAWHQDTTGW